MSAKYSTFTDRGLFAAGPDRLDPNRGLFPEYEFRSMATKIFSRKGFSLSALRKFYFLEGEFGLRKRTIGAADEMGHEYRGQDVAATISLSFPELLWVVVSRRLPSPMSWVYAGLPSKGAKMKRQYYRLLDSSHTDHADRLLVLHREFSDLLIDEVRSAMQRMAGKRLPPSPAQWRIHSKTFPQ